MMKEAKQPFVFYTRLHLQELTSRKARSLKELLENIREVSGSVIYHHTHSFLQRYQSLSPEPPNDFAYWVGEVLGEQKLAEELASIDTIQFSSIRALRNKLTQTIASHIRQMERTGQGQFRVASRQEQFHFVKSISFIFPTPYLAHDLLEFVEVLKKVTINSIYFHVFEAKLRLEKSVNDFSFWIDTNLDMPALAEKLARLDPYTYNLQGLRAKIIDSINNYIKENSK
ncbi:MAG: hypothetical protein JW714_01985 [Candidatus Omnitrophica bacterium]|nr:hypothetical protein [Candidatus Omnitrophota bacterium]